MKGKGEQESHVEEHASEYELGEEEWKQKKGGESVDGVTERQRREKWEALFTKWCLDAILAHCVCNILSGQFLDHPDGPWIIIYEFMIHCSWIGWFGYCFQ